MFRKKVQFRFEELVKTRYGKQTEELCVYAFHKLIRTF
jgi:hypothetical protein